MEGNKYDYLDKNDAKQDEQLSRLNDTLTTISGDIREIMTRMDHFEERFTSYNKEIKDIREVAKSNEQRTSKIETKQTIIATRGESLEKEVSHLKNKLNTEVAYLEARFEKRDEKSDNDRKWLIGTIIAVISIAVTLGVSIFTYL